MPEIRQPLVPPPDGEPSANVRKVLDRFGDKVLAWHAWRGDDTVLVAPETWVEVLRFLKETPGLEFGRLMDLTAVDGYRLDWRPRFQVVAHLYSIPLNHRIRVKAPVDEKDPVLPTLSGLWAGADWFEREVWDMFGIRFEGHPDLKRILMYDEFEGHPLRKDYPYTKRQPRIGPPSPARTPWREGRWPERPSGVESIQMNLLKIGDKKAR